LKLSTLLRFSALGGALLGMAACETFQPAPPPASQIEADADDVVDDRQIVVLARTLASASALGQKAALRGYAVTSQEEMAGLDLVMMVLTIPANMPGDAAIRELESLEPGVSAGVNHAFRAPEPSASIGRGRVYADQLLEWPKDGCYTDAVIGMIDGAVNASDPALAGVGISSRSFTSGEAAIEHGTVTAQILAGDQRLKGVRIQAAAVVADHRLAKDAAGVDSMVRAIDWMQVSGVRLVNVSLAGPYNKILDRALQSAVGKGMIIVAAAGNTGADSPPRYPAAFDNVIAVTAVDVEGKVYGNAVRGDQIDFSAPGVDVFVPVGEGKYISGTSIAAPFVTARIAADQKALAAKGSAELVQGLAKSATDLGAPGRDAIYGHGVPKLGNSCGG
jgi:hypothetical protein